MNSSINKRPIALDRLGRMAGTDRSSLGHGYLSRYERVIRPYLGREFVLLDIASHNEASAHIWARYLTSGHAHIMTPVSTFDFGDYSNVSGIKPSDMSLKSIRDVVEDIYPSVVIDDGSHKFNDQLNAFLAVFPKLVPGGAYIIEDLHTSFGAQAEAYSHDGYVGYSLVEQLCRYISSGRAVVPEFHEIDRGILLSIDHVEVGAKFAVIYKVGNPQSMIRMKPASELQNVEWSWSHSTTAYQRPASILINAPANVANAFERLLSVSPVQARDTESAVICDVDVLFGGVTVDDSGGVAAQSLNCIRNAKETPSILREGGTGRWRIKTPTDAECTIIGKTDGILHVLLKSAWDANYGHWLYDSLSRLSVLAECNIHDEVRIVVDSHRPAMRRVVMDSLRLAGFDESRIQMQSFSNPVHFQRVLIPGVLTDHPAYKSPESTKYLEKISASVGPGRDERIFVTRNRYTRRRLRNEDELWPIFEAMGFVRIVPEELSFVQQVEVFSGARIVAGNLGAAFSNLAFSPQGVKVLALATESMVHDFFYDIVAHKGGSYVGVQGSSVTGEADMSSDFDISESDLRKGLSILLD